MQVAAASVLIRDRRHLLECSSPRNHRRHEQRRQRQQKPAAGVSGPQPLIAVAAGRRLGGVRGPRARVTGACSPSGQRVTIKRQPAAEGAAPYPAQHDPAKTRASHDARRALCRRGGNHQRGANGGRLSPRGGERDARPPHARGIARSLGAGLAQSGMSVEHAITAPWSRRGVRVCGRGSAAQMVSSTRPPDDAGRGCCPSFTVLPCLLLCALVVLRARAVRGKARVSTNRGSVMHVGMSLHLDSARAREDLADRSPAGTGQIVVQAC